MTVTARMSTVWLKLVTVLCLSVQYSAALTAAASQPSQVVWRKSGEDLTIQCRINTEQENLMLLKGLELKQIFNMEAKSETSQFSELFTGRVQLNGKFPSIDFLIKNVSTADTGPYWCLYTVFDTSKSVVEKSYGEGCVLLVVSEPPQECEAQPVQQNLILLSVVVSVAVLLGVIIGTLMWIFFRTRTSHNTVKPRRVATNDVYEDMRGTLHR